MKELIELILQKSLPEGTEFNVTQTEDDYGVVFILEIPEDLRGKIIGKGGRNIKAIRDTVNIIARVEQKRVFLKIAD